MPGSFSISYICESGVEFETRMNYGRKTNDTIMRPHIHDVLEITLVTRGCSHIECGGERVFLNAPFLVCYPPGILHSQNNYSSQIYERWCFPVIPHIIGCAAELPKNFLHCGLQRNWKNVLSRMRGFCSAITTRIAISGNRSQMRT